MLNMINNDKTSRDIALFFGCSVRAVDHARSKARSINNLPVRAGKDHINLVTELANLRKKIRKILEEATTNGVISCPNCKKEIGINSGSPEIAIKASREIRGQMRLEADLAEKWLRVQARREFEAELIEIIMRNCDEKTRTNIQKDLKAKQQALRRQTADW